MNKIKQSLIFSSFIFTLVIILLVVLNYLYLKKTNNIIYFTKNQSWWAWRAKYNNDTVLSISITLISMLVSFYIFKRYINMVIR